MVAGCILGPCVLFIIDLLVRSWPSLRIRNNNTEDTTAELRLYTVMFCSLVLLIGLSIFTWTTRSSIYWTVVILVQGATFLGNMLIYVPCNFCMLDVYGSKYGASVSGASSLSQYALSTAFPLFVPQMYKSLGVR
jgi:hypothetical protein